MPAAYTPSVATEPHLSRPARPLWGQQTALSLRFFAIGSQRMPLDLIHAMAHIKATAAEVNGQLGRLDLPRAQAIAIAATAVAQGQHDAQFPLSVWQTGSGTHSHMNVNEVIAALAQASAPGIPISAHDHVNLGQSSNDVFPSSLHLAAALALRDALLPPLHRLRAALAAKSRAWAGVVKLGRTHLQDATLITLGQEFGGYEAQLAQVEALLQASRAGLHRLALGGTAVGNGVNGHPAFGPAVIARLAHTLNLPLSQSPNLFAAQAGLEPVVAVHAALRALAIALMKIGGDIRLMASGPRGGLGELRLPANEPGSSIMPGKVNPTQVEALTMVCMQVFGHDLSIGMAASQGQLELNTCQPLVALNLLDSLRLLGDAMHSFTQHAVLGLVPQAARLQAQVAASLMLATQLTPHIGHERAADVVQHAEATGSTVRDAALALQVATPDELDHWLDPNRFLKPQPIAHHDA
jgi:fumarate hydratase, class II